MTLLIKANSGFAVLTVSLLLSLACIAFTANMASAQLIDNKVIANYYRNNEAFINAESGIHLVLSQIDQSSTMLENLPITYHPAESSYSVTVSQLNKNSIQINSLASSLDGSAQREIQLQVYYEFSYNLPKAALSSNGKLNLAATATVNNGCEGLSAANCSSAANIAEYQLTSNPSNETQATELCTGGRLGENLIEESALYSGNADDNFLTIGKQQEIVDSYGNTQTVSVKWPNNIPVGSTFYGLEVAENLSPVTLFESTFGVTRAIGVNALQASAEVAVIDMNDGSAISCSQRLAVISDDVSTLYIKGDCDIDSNNLTENKRFTIGSVDNPKLVFIEGGTFTSLPDTGASVIGILYFIPGLTDKLDSAAMPILDPDSEGQYQQVEQQSIDISGIRVNGAVLSDYNCSHDSYDRANTAELKQHFSARFDKTVLNRLYRNINRVAIDSGYSFVEGSWRDF